MTAGSKAQTPELFQLLADLPLVSDSEETLTLMRGNGLRIERIVSRGQASPPDFWYDQEEAEWVTVLCGWGQIEFADGSLLTMQRGDALEIPARCRHRVAATAADEATVWLAVFHRGT